MVTPIPITPFKKSPSIMEWCPQVKLIPELSKIRVFKRGIANGFIGSNIKGGQLSPNSTVELNLKVKNAQKKETKKKTSLIINHPIDHFREDSISLVWNPIREPSLVTSPPQIVKIRTTKKRFKKKKRTFWRFHAKKTKLIKVLKATKDITKGHGLSSTIWKGWNSKFIEIIKRI